MDNRILLYGATGYSGKLIARSARRRMEQSTQLEFVLGGRDARALSQLAHELDMDFIQFGLDDRARVVQVLQSFNLVINAAGPFIGTGEKLAKVAIETGTHYVDINGEVAVYKRLDDLAAAAERRNVTLVSGAGTTAAVSDVMLDVALKTIENDIAQPELGEVRIATSRMAFFSRGSALTMLSAIREEVTIVRADRRKPDEEPRMRLTHIPVGKLERTFDFRMPNVDVKRDHDDRFGRRIGSAASLVDVLTARHTLKRHKRVSEQITGFIEMPLLLRTGYQLGAHSAFMFAMPWVRRLSRAQINQLPAGPDPDERRVNRHRVLLEIEDRYRQTLIDWRLQTPDPYEFTAACVIAISANIALGTFSKPGWQTPSAVLDYKDTDAMLGAPPFAACDFDHREPALVSP